MIFKHLFLFPFVLYVEFTALVTLYPGTWFDIFNPDNFPGPCLWIDNLEINKVHGHLGNVFLQSWLALCPSVY